jgi:hypothetical protein
MHRAKGHSRGTKQYAMPKPARKKLKPLEVAVMFEPTRLAHDCLQAAYTHLIPTLRRRVPIASSQAHPDQIAPSAERNAR